MSKFKFFFKIPTFLLCMFLFGTIVTACSNDKINGVQIEHDDNENGDSSDDDQSN